MQNRGYQRRGRRISRLCSKNEAQKNQRSRSRSLLGSWSRRWGLFLLQEYQRSVTRRSCSFRVGWIGMELRSLTSCPCRCRARIRFKTVNLFQIFTLKTSPKKQVPKSNSVLLTFTIGYEILALHRIVSFFDKPTVRSSPVADIVWVSSSKEKYSFGFCW